VPIGAFEREILRLLAQHRNPESYVAGATVLHAADDSPRTSGDIDVFHDAAHSVAISARADLEVLDAAGYATELVIAFPTFQRATVRRASEAT
jgi:hypothetical protein